MGRVRGEMEDTGGAVFNVKAYFRTSWAQAIRDAVSAAAQLRPHHGTVLFPSGTYDVGESIKVPSGITFAGVGMFASVIRFTRGFRDRYDNHADALFDIAGTPADPKRDIHFHDLAMLGTNMDVVAAPEGAIPRFIYMHSLGGAEFGSVSRVIIERCRFEYSIGAGVGGFDPANVVVRDCIASNNGENGINVNGFHHQIVRNRGENNRSAMIEAAVGFSLVAQNYARGSGVVGISVGGFTQTSPYTKGWYNVVTENICVQNRAGMNVTSGVAYSIVANNICHANTFYGIFVVDQSGTYPGVETKHNVLHGNVCTSNGGPNSPQPYGIQVRAPETRVIDNKLADVPVAVADVDAAEHAQKFGVLVYGGANNEVIGNDSRGHDLHDYSFEGPLPPTNSVLRFVRPEARVQALEGTSFAPASREVLEFQVALAFGNVQANDSVERDVPLEGVRPGSSVSAGPRSALPRGLTWSAYAPGANQVRVRVTNVTGSDLRLESMPWSIGVIVPAI